MIYVDIITYKLFLLASGNGFNAATGEMVDMMEEGIIDPLKVVKTAL